MKVWLRSHRQCGFTYFHTLQVFAGLIRQETVVENRFIIIPAYKEIYLGEMQKKTKILEITMWKKKKKKNQNVLLPEFNLCLSFKFIKWKK